MLEINIAGSDCSLHICSIYLTLWKEIHCRNPKFPLFVIWPKQAMMVRGALPVIPLRTPQRGLISFTYIVRFPLVDRYFVACSIGKVYKLLSHATYPGAPKLHKMMVGRDNIALKLMLFSYATSNQYLQGEI